MEILVNGKVLQIKKEIDEKDWEIDTTPNFVNFPTHHMNAKTLREKRYTKYEHFTKFINAMYPNHKNILDVGCAKGESTSLLQELGYNVTAIDKFDTYQKILLTARKINYTYGYFDLNTDTSQYDLITGLHCCEGIEMIIRNCLRNDKEFVVTVCETKKGLYQEEFSRNRKQYIDYLKGVSNKIKMTILPIYDDFYEYHWG